jgi:hypothetical protein
MLLRMSPVRNRIIAVPLSHQQSYLSPMSGYIPSLRPGTRMAPRPQSLEFGHERRYRVNRYPLQRDIIFRRYRPAAILAQSVDGRCQMEHPDRGAYRDQPCLFRRRRHLERGHGQFDPHVFPAPLHLQRCCRASGCQRGSAIGWELTIMYGIDKEEMAAGVVVCTEMPVGRFDF